MTFDDFEQAKEHAEEAQLRVCGTFALDGTAKYFLANFEQTDAEIRDQAFQIRNGRSMTSYERWALEVAEREHETASA